MGSEFLRFVAQVPGAIETGLLDFATAVLDKPDNIFKNVDEQDLIQWAKQLGTLRQGLPAQGGSTKPAYWAYLTKKLNEANVLNKVTGSSGNAPLVPSTFPAVQNPKEFDTTSQRLTGNIAEAYERAGLVNRAYPDHVADMGQFVKTLIDHIKDDLPGEEAQKLQGLAFKQYKGKLKKPSEVLLAGWPGDLYELYKVVEKLKPDDKVAVARKILVFTTQFFGLDFEAFRNDLPTYQLKPFDFKDFTFDVFVNGALRKGHVTPNQTLLDLKQAIQNKDVILSPQGTEVINALLLLYPATGKLKDIFNNFTRIHIEESLAAKGHMTLVGDGLSGEQGAHFVASDEAHHYNIVAPDITRDASMVTGALRYLQMIANDRRHVHSRTQDIYLNAGQFFVGAANIGEPLSFAQTIGQVLHGGAIYLSLAYAPRIEIPLIVGGHIAAQALQDKVLGILRLQSPTTMQPQKNDLTPEQGFAYAFGQWMKDLAALVEANNGKHTSIDTWPIVRTFSVEQNANFKRLIEQVNADPGYGIRFATPKDAGEMIHEPLDQLIEEIQRNARNTRKLVISVNRSEGLRDHNNRTMTIIAKAMANMWFGNIAGIISGKIKKILRSTQQSAKPVRGNLPEGFVAVASVSHLKSAVGQSSGLLADALGKSGATTLVAKGVDTKAVARQQAKSKGPKARALMSIGEFQAGSFPLLALEDIRRRNPGQCQYYFKKDTAGKLIEAGLFEKNSGARVGYRLDEGQIQMFIKPPAGHPGGEIAFPYSFEPLQSIGKNVLVAQVPDQVTAHIGKRFTLDSYSAHDSFINRAPSELGLITERAVTAHPQTLVGNILKILAQPELGIDLSSVTIDRLEFRGRLPEGGTHTSRSFSIDKVYSAEKKDGVRGQIVEGRITTHALVEGVSNTTLEVFASIFVNGNKTEGELIQIPKPKALQLGANGILTSLTVMSKELWKKFVELGGDPNPIHTVDLAASAGGAKGTFAPGFGIAAQIETLLRRKFAGSLVENLALSFLGKMGPGMTYDVRINPSSKSEAKFDLQVIKKGSRSRGKDDEVLVDGSFDLIADEISEGVDNGLKAVTSTEVPVAAIGGMSCLLPTGIPMATGVLAR